MAHTVVYILLVDSHHRLFYCPNLVPGRPNQDATERRSLFVRILPDRESIGNLPGMRQSNGRRIMIAAV